jgi:ribonuclease HI
MKIEGDSQVIIQLISKILNGKPLGRISPSWRLAGLLEDFGEFIHPNLILIPSHIKRDANKVADYLANSGIDSKVRSHPLASQHLRRDGPLLAMQRPR